MVQAMRGLVITAVVLGGCGRLGFEAEQAASTPAGDAAAMSPVTGDGAVPGGDGAPASGDASTPPTDGTISPGTGSGTISGTAPDGKPFTTLVAGYVIGHPQYAGETSIYMFSGPIQCSDLGFPGWGAWITGGTQTMELELPARTITSYPVQSTEPPASPNSYGRYRYGEGGGGEITGWSSAGQIEVTSVAADGSISGTFSVTFVAGGQLDGTYTAVACPTGYYPTFP